jgi:hypothetical protein
MATVDHQKVSTIIRVLDTRARLNQAITTANELMNEKLIIELQGLRDKLDEITDVVNQCDTYDERGQVSHCLKPYCTGQVRRRVMRNFGTPDDEAIYERVLSLVEGALTSQVDQPIAAGMYWGLYLEAALAQLSNEVGQISRDGEVSADPDYACYEQVSQLTPTQLIENMWHGGASHRHLI